MRRRQQAGSRPGRGGEKGGRLLTNGIRTSCMPTQCLATQPWDACVPPVRYWGPLNTESLVFHMYNNR